jgi:hypothetical protein
MAQAPIEPDAIDTPVAPVRGISGISAQAANAILTNKPLPTAATTSGYATAQDAQAAADQAAADAAARAIAEKAATDKAAADKLAADKAAADKAKADSGVTQSAKDIVNGYLREAGLSGLADKAWSQWNSGTSAEQIMDWVRQQPEYATRFPAMAALRSAGRSITEGQYVAKEQADIDMMTTYGIPADIATNRTLLGSLIANNVNQVTLQERLMAGQDSIMSQNKDVLAYAKEAFGLTPGDLTAFVLNPDIAVPVLQQKAKAIQIGGAAFQAQQAVDANQAMALAAAGITAQQAQQGFGNIAQQGQFKQELPGDISGNLSNEELVNAQFGMDPVALAKLKKVAATRAGTFQEGGQFTSSATGVGGIGSAPSV